MSDGPFVKRLAEAIQHHHESTMALQQLASELIDHTQRMRSFTDRLHVMKQELMPPSEEALVLPRALKNGPILGER